MRISTVIALTLAYCLLPVGADVVHADDRQQCPGWVRRIENYTPNFVQKMYEENNGIVNCVDKLDELRRSPLHYAASSHHTIVVNKLIELNADITMQAANGMLPIHFAAQTGCKSDVKPFLNRANEPDMVELFGDTSVLEARDLVGRTPLFYAIFQQKNRRCKKEKPLVGFLLKNGAKVNGVDIEGKTALMLAAGLDDVPVMVSLLRRKASINAKDVYGETAVYYAIHGSAYKALKLLMGRKADLSVTNNGGMIALQVAVGQDQPEAINLLVRGGADVYQTTTSEKCPMRMAVTQRHLKSVVALLRIFKRGRVIKALEMNEVMTECVAYTGEDTAVNEAVDDNGNTLLHYMAEMGYDDGIKYLVSRGWKVNRRNKAGQTALHLAANAFHYSTVRLLVVKMDASVNICDLDDKKAVYGPENEIIRCAELRKKHLEMRIDNDKLVAAKRIVNLLKSRP